MKTSAWRLCGKGQPVAITTKPYNGRCQSLWKNFPVRFLQNCKASYPGCFTIKEMRLPIYFLVPSCPSSIKEVLSLPWSKSARIGQILVINSCKVCVRLWRLVQCCTSTPIASITHCCGFPVGYYLSTDTRILDDHSALNSFTRSGLSEFLCPLTRNSYPDINGDYTTFGNNARKRHNTYTTPTSSKKIKDNGCSIFGEVITPLSCLSSGKLLSPPIDAVSTPLNLNCGQVWIDILEEPEEVSI